MMKKQKTLSLLLAALTLAQTMAAVSCGSDKQTGPSSDGTTPAISESSVEEEETDSLEARAKISDNLPNISFDGAPFTIITPDYGAPDFYAENESGVLLNDIIYRRNAAVRDRFNIEIKVVDNDYASISHEIRKTITAQEDAYQMISHHMIDTAMMAADHLYADMNAMEYLDFDQPWWNQTARDNLSIGNKVYLMSGSLSQYFFANYFCVYMNKKLGTDSGLTNTIYDTVLNGEFTIDYYMNQIRNTWRDLDGDSKPSDKDYYGLAAQVSSYSTPFIYSFGETTVGKNEEGMPVLRMNQQKFADMVEKVYDLFYGINGTLPTDGWELHKTTFNASRALFYDGVFEDSYIAFKELSDDYCILPYPKWDTDQKEYYTTTDGSSPLTSIPITVRDTEFVSVITEALCAESWKTAIPKYYDLILKTRGVRDETSVKVIDMIEKGAVLDFGFVYGNYSGMGFTMSNLMLTKNKNFASYYAQNSKKWEQHIEEIVKAYTAED